MVAGSGGIHRIDRPVDAIERSSQGRSELEPQRVELLRHITPRVTLRGSGRRGEGCEGEHECDKGCEVHDDDNDMNGR